MTTTNVCVVILRTQDEVAGAVGALRLAGIEPWQVAVRGWGPAAGLGPRLAGVPERVASDYTAALRRGRFVVAVDAPLDALSRAERLLGALGHDVDMHASLPV